MTAKYRIKQYQHLVESDTAIMNSCEAEIQKLESQIQDTSANLDAIIAADSDAQKGKADYEAASKGWKKYRAASDEILQLSREGKQQEAAKLMIGEVYEEYKAFTEKLTILRDEFHPIGNTDLNPEDDTEGTEEAQPLTEEEELERLNTQLPNRKHRIVNTQK